MHYKMNDNDDHIQVRLFDVGSQANRFLKEFHSCRTGSCTCNSKNFDELDSIDVQKSGSKLIVTLYPRDGASLRVSHLETCLDHSIQKTEQSE